MSDKTIIGMALFGGAALLLVVGLGLVWWLIPNEPDETQPTSAEVESLEQQLAEAEEEAEGAHDDGYDEGYDDGYDDGVDDTESELEDASSTSTPSSMNDYETLYEMSFWTTWEDMSSDDRDMLCTYIDIDQEDALQSFEDGFTREGEAEFDRNRTVELFDEACSSR